jgi:hypothetical protein
MSGAGTGLRLERGPLNALTDVPGVRVGHFTHDEVLRGVTAILCEDGAGAGVSVRGSNPGTINTDALAATTIGSLVHGIGLSGDHHFRDRAACWTNPAGTDDRPYQTSLKRQRRIRWSSRYWMRQSRSKESTGGQWSIGHVRSVPFPRVLAVATANACFHGALGQHAGERGDPAEGFDTRGICTARWQGQAALRRVRAAMSPKARCR